MLPIDFSYGELVAGNKYLADGAPEEILVQLHPKPKPGERQLAAAAPPARPKPLAVGQPTPEWQVGAWSDGEPRKLADLKGKVVFLDFWGIWCGPCISSLPVLAKLKSEFEPRGAVFLSIHTPGESEKTVRRLLEFHKVALLFAVDQDRQANGDNRPQGVTADRYRIRGFPSMFLIDRAGKIALSPGDPNLGPKVQAIIKEAGIELGSKQLTEEQSHLLLYRLFKQEIENVLKTSQ